MQDRPQESRIISRKTVVLEGQRELTIIQAEPRSGGGASFYLHNHTLRPSRLSRGPLLRWPGSHSHPVLFCFVPGMSMSLT